MVDTIFALSSGFGRAAIAVVRVSGPAVGSLLVAMAGQIPAPRRAVLRTVRDARDGRALDRALVLHFPAPASETGEDVCEFQLHGGRAVVSAVCAALAAFPGVRHAEPGEFARRALLNGKMDLLDLESLADLIDAETEVQRRQALEGAGSLLRGRAESWREQLLAIRADLEATIDFSDEGDVQESYDSSPKQMIAALVAELDAALQSGVRGEIIREGFRVALLGPPNAGKSSLLNALAGRDVAIVSEVAGTTRDRLEVALDLGGLPVLVSDTAGLRESSECVEREGMRRAWAAAKDADLILWLSPADAPCAPDAGLLGDPRLRYVLSKCDLDMVREPSGGAWRISVRDGVGLQDALEAIAVEGRKAVADRTPALVTRERQKLAIADARAHLLNAEHLADVSAELCCEEIRLSERFLGQLLGRNDVEDVLGVIFSRFCIGK